MQIGMIGLGRMGGNMATRLVKGGHDLVVFDRNPGKVQKLVDIKAVGAKSFADLVQRLNRPRAIWMMIAAGAPIDQAIETLLPLLDRNDIIIDGGNSYYKDTIRRAEMLRDMEIAYIDVGTSGGVWGLTEGYSMMVGGPDDVVKRFTPIFETLAPAKDKGWGHVGPSGAGHFVKMVHNGIEYGMMEAYAEGFSILKAKKEFDLDLHQVSQIWQYGSVVRSWLLDLAEEIFKEDQELAKIAPYVFDSGEGRWTTFEAIDLNVAAPIISLSLLERIRSRDADSFSDKVLAMMRNKFGGHIVKPENQDGR